MDNMQQQFIEAGTLMLAGMVFVFAFLSLLIIFINTVLAKLSVKFPDAVVESKPRASKKTSKAVSGEVSPAVVAAITSAVSSYQRKHSQSKS
ncbi:OadG family protein [Litorilituus lipolyticus]|uniref:Probable oxaloacetate decarboxylase gamma chain n=1 Tax=Litorilituus lipolyticus TaxID=2491017 RepID=A0A502L619_9GAMM|nr:OadG family transporter subunit [Litorilituus lipolyticus]TPH19352.1 oxaloacetate decarboxylase subunit gamma [Litorilituus lipolyticus]